MSPGSCRHSADFRIGAGNTAGNVCRSDLSEPFKSVCKTGAHFRFTRLNPGFQRHCVCVSQPCPSFPGRASCPRNVPSYAKTFSGCPPSTIKVILDAHSLSCTLHFLTHTHTIHTGGIIQFTHTCTCDKAKHYFSILLTSSHKVWSQRRSLQFVQRTFCECLFCES